MHDSPAGTASKQHRVMWEAGLHVFPLYGASQDEGGQWRCDCGNPDCGAPFKHPRARNWQHTPLWDDEQIDNIDEAGWFATGYGILCRGLLVVDVDVRNGGADSYARLLEDVPEVAGAGMIVETGRGDGGKHLYFSLPDAVPMVTHLPQFPGLDFKSSGFVVGPGARHASGGLYRVGYGSPDDIDPAPTALIEMLRKPERHRAEYDGRSVDVSHADIADMLTHIDPDGSYDDWIRIGMAIHHATGGTGFSVWDAWSATGSKYDAEKMEGHWHSFGRSANPATLGTLVHHAEAGGWVWPVSFGTPAVPDDDDGEPAPAADAGPVPGYDPARPPGYVGEVAAWIESQNRRPRARASVGAALWVTSCLFANWTDDLDDVNLNLMAFVVAGSGTGKDSIQKAATTLLRIAGLAPAVHGTIKSEKEIVENLLRHQVAHYNIDEVGELLLKIQNAKRRGGAAHHEGTMGMLMSAYSKADGHLLIGGDRKEEVRSTLLKEVSALQKRIDEGTADDARKAAPRLAAVRRALDGIDQGIERPYLTMIGFTVPQTFEQLMDYETATNGFMRRAILFQEHDTAPQTKRGFRKTPLPDDMDRLVRMVSSNGTYDPEAGRIDLAPVRREVRTSSEAARMLRQAVTWFDEQAVAHKSKSGMEALYMGAYEQVSRISALLACWGGVREAEHVRWAFETVRRDVQAKALAVTANDRAKDSPQTALQARLLSLCGGGDGMTLGVLVNRCRKFRRDDVEREISAMVAAGGLRAETEAGKNGRESTKYYAG